MTYVSYLNLVLTWRQGENNKFGIYSNDKLQVDLQKNIDFWFAILTNDNHIAATMLSLGVIM